MALKEYFAKLIERVENSEEISNAGKDDEGFYRPTKTILLRNLNLLRDLHDKPRAKQMVKSAWNSVAEDLPPEWLTMDDADRSELKKILAD